MKKIYYLKTCDTCKRILHQIQDISSFELQDIKEKPLTAQEIDALQKQVGSYERLVNKRAKLYTEMGLKNQTLLDQDYRTYLLEHYTFLARPVVLFKDQIFIGNSKKTVEAMLQMVNKPI